MCRSFVDTNRFAKKLYHVHDLDRVVCIILSHELNKAITLVLLSNTVLWHVNIDHRSSLHKHLPKQCLADFVIKPTNINSGILVSFCYRPSSHFNNQLNDVLFI